MELLFDNAYLSQVINDKKSWFPQMEVLDLFYHQYFFAANSLGLKPTTSQFFQPPIPQSLALVAAAIHWVLSEYATGKKVTVMLSQDEYQGKFCPSTVIDCTTWEAIALINYTWWGCFIPPPPQMVLLRDNRCSSIHVGAPQSPSALLNPCPQSKSAHVSLDLCFNISFGATYCLSVCASPLGWTPINPLLNHD